MKYSFMKVAIIHDWLVNLGGAERVLEEILTMYPEAEVFTIVDFLTGSQRDFLAGHKVHTSFIQKLPFARSKYRSYLPFMPYAIEQFNMSGFDLIISSSHSVAKGVITGPEQKHICMCYSPMRYAWDMQEQYLQDAGISKGIRGLLIRWILHYVRRWDVRTANGVDEFIAISDFIAQRIWKVYRRESTVIHPPVDTVRFTLQTEKQDYYLSVSRLVPYKRIDEIVKAFTAMPDKRLVVIGEGPDFKKLKEIAGDNVELLGYQPDRVVEDYLKGAKAFIFAAEDDFGIAPVEALACGTPVIAFGRGGARETVRGFGEADTPTGIFFSEQKAGSILDAVNVFEEHINEFSAASCRENAMEFAVPVFEERLRMVVNKHLPSQKD